ncbi:MAG TPA: hypothetical protein VMU17_02040, partial [Elusimicrobiota bacterium]|nr:hypothetical protein [Elusimicrobiota bacterium]
IPESTRVTLLHRLVQQGNLSGPELAAVLLSESEIKDDSSAATFQLIGMEEPKLYRENLGAYERVLANRDQALRALGDVRRLQDSIRIPEPNLLASQLERTENLLRLKLTPNDYAEYLKGKVAVPSSPALDPTIDAAEDFYRLVNARSTIFLAEALNKVPAATGPRVIVVGGFHTALMAEKLKALGRSYVVLTPAITQSGVEELYEKRMMESVCALQVVKPFAALDVAHPSVNPPAGKAAL